MAPCFRLRATLALAFSAGLLVLPLEGKALNVVYNGTTYDLETATGSYDSQPSLFATPANGGRMPWWGDEALANGLASQLAAGLSPFPYPPDGPLFATALNVATISGDVTASFFDLTTLGSTDVVMSGEFPRSSMQTYVLLTVPAPLPLAAPAVVFTASRRLRRLSSRLRRQSRRP
jgi:hypothetical protein